MESQYESDKGMSLFCRRLERGKKYLFCSFKHRIHYYQLLSEGCGFRIKPLTFKTSPLLSPEAYSALLKDHDL